MHHIDVQHRIGALDGPLGHGGVELERRSDIGQAAGVAPRRDRDERVRMGIRRLPFELGKTLGKEHDVLAGPARDFEHETSFRQPFAEDLGDIFAIAQHCGG